MKKRLTIWMLLTLAATCCAWAQSQVQVMKVYSGNTVLMSQEVSKMDSIKSIGGMLLFYYEGGSQSFPVGSVDSVGFAYASSGGGNSDTTHIDTTGCVHIVWHNGTVAVTNPYSNSGLTITTNGEKVSAVSTCNIAGIVYWLEGSSDNGSFTLNTDRKYTLLLGGLTLTNPTGAAIKVTTDYKGVIHLAKGSTNTLSDGTGSSDKGALQSQGKIEIQGGGTLNVYGYAKHGVQTSGSTTVLGGTLNVLTAVKDGMNVDNFIMSGGTVSVTNDNGDGIDGDQGYIVISGGTVTVTCSADDVKGMGCDSALTISGGTVNITVSGDQSKGIKSKDNITISGGTVTVNANGDVVLESSGSGYDPSYCTGIKASGTFRMIDGTLTVVCPTSNGGGRCIATDNNIYIYGGNMNLSSLGSCTKYTNSEGTQDTYVATCMKSDGNITISGGTHTMTATGRCAKAEALFTMTGGNTTMSTTGGGFTVIGSGTSCTDGFAPACVKADSTITLTAGTLTATSTGKGGRGLVSDARMVCGTLGGADSLLHVSVQTSGTAVNATSGGGWGGESTAWKGLPKGIKIEDDIMIFSGIITSYCAQTSGSTTGEAIETKDTMYIYGGQIETNAYDDAINAGKYLSISGGKIWAYSRGNDAIDCNGYRIDVSGGTIVVKGQEVAIDDNGDRGGKLYVTGGTIVLVGGNMGTTEATPQVTGQKSLSLGSSSWGGSGSSVNASNGFCVKNSSGDEIMTYKMPNVSGSGFQNAGGTGTKPPPGGGGSGRIWLTAPNITAGTYSVYSSPTISGGTHWHGLYSGATVTTSGTATTVTAQ